MPHQAQRAKLNDLTHVFKPDLTTTALNFLNLSLPEALLKLTLGLHKAYLKHSWHTCRLHKAYLKYMWSILKVYLKHTWNILKAYLKPTLSITEACLKHGWNMTKAYLKPNLILLYPYLTPLTTFDLLEGFEENGVTYVRTYVRTDGVTSSLLELLSQLKMGNSLLFSQFSLVNFFIAFNWHIGSEIGG